jgi:hypothetical protein
MVAPFVGTRTRIVDTSSALVGFRLAQLACPTKTGDQIDFGCEPTAPFLSLPSA